MKLFLFAVAAILFLSSGNACFAQSKGKTIEWINTRGEEIIKEITDHSSIHWELDKYGSLRITDYNPPEVPGTDKEVVKIYSYLNLNELVSVFISTDTSSEVQRKEAFRLLCKKPAGGCIKRRYDFKDGSLRYKELDSYSFPLKRKYKVVRAKKLESKMMHILSTYSK